MIDEYDEIAFMLAWATPMLIIFIGLIIKFIKDLLKIYGDDK